MPEISNRITSRAKNGRKTGAQLSGSKIPADVMAYRRDRIAEITGDTNTVPLKDAGSTDTSSDSNQTPPPCGKCGWYCANRADCRAIRKLTAIARRAGDGDGTATP